MALFLGLLSAGAYGTSDFLGGFVTRRNPVSAVVFAFMAVGLVVALALVAVFPEAWPHRRVVALSVVLGLVGPAAVAMLYAGLAVGRMSVVAPISAVGGSVLPVFWGVATGERPSVVALLGVATAIVAIGIVARGPEAEPLEGGSRTRELLLAGGAGIGFGAVFILFAETGDNSGFWPLLVSRATSVPAVAAAALLVRMPLRLSRRELPQASVAGVLDLSANALQLVALRAGLLSLVAPVAGLYSAVTVVLARVLLKERMGRSQIVGLFVALTGLVLIAVG